MILNWKLSFYKRLLLTIVFVHGLIWTNAQSSYNLRFSLADFNLSDSIACYDLEISNGGSVPWTLAFTNIYVFYDAQVGCFLRDTIIGENLKSERDLRITITSPGDVTNSSLAYEDSLGSFRVNLSSIIDNQGEVLDSNGTWAGIFRMCFKIKLDDITDPNTCFQMDFGTQQTLDAIGAVSDIVQQWDESGTSSSPVPFGQHFHLVPNRSLSACFVVAENSDDLCSDGIDNDEDGLLDCDDEQCSPGNVTIESIPIECFRPEGSIYLRGGNSELQYSIDGGATYSTQDSFPNLMAGIYDVVIRAGEVNTCAITQTRILEQPDCSEADNLSCSDGMDNDGDGLVDCEDESCQPRIEAVVVQLPSECPDLMNGVIEIVTDFPEVEYSIDSGRTFRPDADFESIGEGIYWLVIRNSSTMCNQFYGENPVVLMSNSGCPTLGELCQDGIDNDSDGFVDCEDLDCLTFTSCEDSPPYSVPNIISSASSENSVFNLQSDHELIIESFRVYNRWGGLVHVKENTSSEDPSHLWAIENNEPDVPSGVYIYHLQINLNGVIINKLGNITVIN